MAGESISDISEADRMRILTDEQKAISLIEKPKDLDGRIASLESVIREARLRLQINVTRQRDMVEQMSATDREMWLKERKNYKVKPAAVDPSKPATRGTRAAPMSADEKAIRSMAAAIGCTLEEAKVMFEERKKKGA